MQTQLKIRALLLIGALAWAWPAHAGQLTNTNSGSANEDEISFAQHRRVAAQYRLAAERGSASGMCNLGDMFMGGHGVERSPAEAYRWYLAALHAAPPVPFNGSVPSSRLTSEQHRICNRNRKNAASMLSPRERAEAKQVARAWLERVVYTTNSMSLQGPLAADAR